MTDAVLSNINISQSMWIFLNPWVFIRFLNFNIWIFLISHLWQHSGKLCRKWWANGGAHLANVLYKMSSIASVFLCFNNLGFQLCVTLQSAHTNARPCWTFLKHLSESAWVWYSGRIRMQGILLISSDLDIATIRVQVC